MAKVYMLILGSEEELGDIHTWLDEHPDNEEMAEAGITDPDIKPRLDSFLGRLRDESEPNAYPSYHPVPTDLAPVLELAMNDWCEVLTAHDEEFRSSLITTEA